MITRHRRQHHRGSLVHIDFELARGGNPVHRQRVTLRPMPIMDMEAALAGAGMPPLQALPGPGGFAEVLSARKPARPL